MTALDLHALANAPGYGRAADALRNAGCWDESRDPTLPGWTVRVSGTITTEVEGEITVWAADEASARHQVRERDDEIEWDGGHLSHEIDEWEIEEVSRAPDCPHHSAEGDAP